MEILFIMKSLIQMELLHIYIKKLMMKLSKSLKVKNKILNNLIRIFSEKSGLITLRFIK